MQKLMWNKACEDLKVSTSWTLKSFTSKKYNFGGKFCLQFWINLDWKFMEFNFEK